MKIRYFLPPGVLEKITWVSWPSKHGRKVLIRSIDEKLSVVKSLVRTSGGNFLRAHRLMVLAFLWASFSCGLIISLRWFYSKTITKSLNKEGNAVAAFNSFYAEERKCHCTRKSERRESEWSKFRFFSVNCISWERIATVAGTLALSSLEFFVKVHWRKRKNWRGRKHKTILRYLLRCLNNENCDNLFSYSSR